MTDTAPAREVAADDESDERASTRATLRTRVLRPALSALAAAALLAGLLIAVHQEDWSSLADLLRPRSIPLLALASLANLVGLLLAMASWWVLLVDMAGPVGFARSARTYFTGVISKLVPGRVWTLLIHIRFALSIGVTAGRITTVFLASTLVGLFTGAAVGLSVAPAMLGARAAWLTLPALIVVVCLARPELVERLAAILARTVRRPTLVLSASSRAVRRSLALGLISWLVSGLNLWIIAVMLGAPMLGSLPLCIGGFALATVGGSLVLILPDGWGIRELLLTVALRGEMPWSHAAAAAIASRFVVLVSEVAGGLAALAAGRRADRTRAEEQRSRE